MKRVAVLVAALFFTLGAALSTASAEEPPLDLGEASPFVAACVQLTAVGEMGGFDVRNCRRAAPDEIAGNRALIHVRIATTEGVFLIDTELHKSVWNVSAFATR